MKVKKHTLLLIACIVWSIAGVNILRIGIISYQDYTTLMNIVLSFIVFMIFWFMVFSKLTKSTQREYVRMKLRSSLF